MSMDVTPYVYLPVLFAATCKYTCRYDISHFVLSKLFLVKYVYYPLLFVMGYLTFRSNGPHCGHRVNYRVSKPTAEHVLKHSEFLFIRNTILETAGTHLFKNVSSVIRNKI